MLMTKNYQSVHSASTSNKYKLNVRHNPLEVVANQRIWQETETFTDEEDEKRAQQHLFLLRAALFFVFAAHSLTRSVILPDHSEYVEV